MPGEAAEEFLDLDRVDAVLTRHDKRNVERGVGLHQLVGRSQVALGEDQERCHPRVIGSDQDAVDHARTGFGIGQCSDKHELVSIRDEHALDRVIIIGAAAQCGGTCLDTYDASESVDRTAEVADDGDSVADHDSLAAELASLHCIDIDAGLIRAADDDGEATTVDRDDEAGAGVVVAGAFLAARA